MPQTTTVQRTSAAPRNRQFLDDPRAFKRIYRASRNSWRAGEHPLDTYLSAGPNVLGEEMSAAGNLFGVEIEFDFQDSSSINDLAGDLHAAGILPNSYRSDYHANSSETRRWRFEYDGTVTGGEVITPVMRDVPDSWVTLSKALATISDRGGRAEGTNVGGHVSVDASAFDSPLQRARLLKLAMKFEDVMYRLATNPYRARYATPEGGRMLLSTHRRRANHFCEPIRISEYNDNPLHRDAWLNDDGYRHRFEFRIFDGSLEPSVVQTNILIATAMVRAAMNPDIDEMLDSMPDRPIGWHRAQEWRTRHEGNRPRLIGEDWANDTLAIREFVDIMFDNTVDKERIITLYALNDWSFARRNGRRSSGYRTQYN